MKKLFTLFGIALCFFLLSNSNSFAQLNGTYTIPGSYATITAAVNDINTVGLSGPVIFNVAAGYTESVTAPILLTATGTSTNTITFQKSGAGANPLITRTDAGTLATSTLGGQGDAIIIIQGSDYVTFDGISVTANNSSIEYGYYLRKASATNGCKYVTIKNAVVTMNKGTSAYVVGIYSSNNDAASLVSSAVGITVTSTGGRHENVTMTGNTVQNVHVGILLRGFNHTTSPYDFYDQNFVIGQSGAGNIIQNYAGGNASAAYGVYLIYHTSPTVSYNTINNAGGGGVNATSTLYGIFMSTSSAAGNCTYNNNTITLGQGSTSGAHCIYDGQVGLSKTINNNSFSYGTFASTTASYMVYASSATNNVTFSGNSISGTINKTGAGSLYLYYNGGSPTGGTETITNNTFSNVTVTGASTFYCFYSNTSTSQNRVFSGNTISSITGGTSTVYCMYLLSSLSNSVYNNNIYTVSSAGTIYGLYFTGTNPTVYNNNIYGISSSGASIIYGMYNGGTGTTNCYRNRIYNISGSNASSTIYGIYITTGTQNNVYNNFVSDLRATAANAAIPIAGIYVTGGTAVNLFYNTIFLNATSSGALFGVRGIYASTTPTLDMRNNIVVTTSTPNGAGLNVAYMRNSATLTSYSANSNNNCFYAGIPSASNLIYTDGTNTAQTIDQYKTIMSPREAASFSELPPFVNIASTPYDLHLQTTVATQCESGGTRITSPIAITDDYDANTRWGETGYTGTGTAVDVGADEFNGIPQDVSPPTMSYTPLSNTSSTSSRVLTTTITDPSGVPTSGIGLPVLYWKINAGAYTPVTATYVSGSTYSFTFGSGVVAGDIVSYYICAQDNASPPNIGASPFAGASGFTSNPPACSTPPTTPNSYTILAGISGTKTVGAVGADYATLTSAIADLNSKELNGALTLLLIDATYPSETFPITINANPGSSATNTVTIRPQTGVTTTLSGSSASSILKINGADYITIDGSNCGGTDKSLTIENTVSSGTTAVIWIGSLGTGLGANNVTIKNCNLRNGFNGATSYGIFSGNNSTIGNSGDDNEYTTIQNNFITRAYYGIRIYGGTVNYHDNLLIKQNKIGTTDSAYCITYYGIYLYGANTPEIAENEILGIRTSASLNIAGINIDSYVAGAKIQRNNIHYLRSVSASGYGAYGINIATATGNNGTEIINNVIYDILTSNYSTTSTTWNPFGIRITGGSGHKIYHNSINMFGQPYTGTAASMSACLLYTANTVTGTDVRNNIFANSCIGLSGTKSYTVYVPTGTTFSNINYNDYYPSGTYGILGYNGADVTTIAAWRIFTSQDINSINSDPLFNSNTNLQPLLGSPVLAAGTPVGITTDYLGNLRSGTNPSIGAYENGADGAPPVIAYTPLGNTTSTANRVLTTTITDVSGVPTSGIGLPVLYWKINSGAYSPVTANYVSSNTYEFTFGAGANVGDVISYYICAQDNASPANVGASPSAGASGFTANPPACSTPPTTPNSYTIVGSISGTKTVGASGADYPTLTAAINDLNSKVLEGPLEFILIDATYPSETFPIVINPNSGSDAANTVTIKPQAGVSATISGSSASSIIKINGADYITIDGSNSGGTDRSLTIENTNAAASTAGIWLSSLGVGAGATYNTIMNCNIKTGSNTLTTYGIFSGGASIGSAGSDNDFNTLQNNGISKAYYGIDVLGVSGSTSDYLSITDNTIGSNTATDYVLYYGIYISQTTNSDLSHNEIFNMKHNSNKYGIYSASGSSFNKYSKNKIHDFEDLDGNTSIHTSIGLAFETGLTDNTIDNNVIYKVFARYGTTNNYQNCGIRVIGGTNYKIYFNSISMTGTLTRATSGIYSTCLHIYSSATSNMDVRNNIFYNAVVPYSGYTSNNYLMYVTSTSTFTNLNYNDYYSTSANMGYYNGTTCATFVAWQTATGQDANSISVNPQFTSTTDLRPNLGSPVLAAGTPISGFPTDYLGVSRSGTTPSMGAYEQGVDLTGPSITYTLITNTTSTSNRTLTSFATITDPSGVNTTSSRAPRIYYKKSTDANDIVGNTALDNGWKWTEATNPSSPFDFVIDYSIIFGGSVVMNDIIQYFVVAQDLAPVPNVGINSGVFATTPGNVDLRSSNCPITGTINQYKIVDVALAGTYSVGLNPFNKATGKNLYYEKFKRFVVKELDDNQINIENGSDSKFNINSKIDNNIIQSDNIKTNSTQNDNHNFIKDKSNVVVNDDLNTKSSVDFQFDDKSYKRYITVEEEYQVIMENGKPYVGERFVFLNNDVRNNNTNNKGFIDSPDGVFLTITDAITNLSERGVSGAVTFNLVDATYPTETYPFIINTVQGVSSTNTVTIKPGPGMTPVISGASASGPIFKIYNSNYITIDGSNNGTNSRDLSIENTSTTSPQVIWIGSSGTTPITNVTVKNCNIKNGATTSSAIVISDGNASGTAGYFNNITIQNNAIKQAYIGLYAISVVAAGNGSGTLITQNDLNFSGADAIRLVCLYAQGLDGATISNNNLGNMANTVDATNITGIWFATGVINSTISGNTISTISGTAGGPRGIYISSGSTNSNISITSNTINDLTTSSTATSMGLAVTSTTTGVNINKNKIYNISNTNASGYNAYGINLSSTSTTANFNVTNNLIYNVYGYGWASQTTDNGYGIYIGSGGGYNLYHNSVCLSTEQSSATGVPACIMITSSITTANSLDIRNNIFHTNQTVGTNRYAILCNAANTVFANINYNNYYSAGPNLGYIGSIDRATLANWRTGSGQDAYSINGVSGFTSTTNLQPDVNNPLCWNINGKGDPTVGIATDFLGNSRSVLVSTGASDIGAYEFTPAVDPNDATQTGTIADGNTTTYTVAGNVVASITWHSGSGTLPTSISVKYRSGENPSGTPVGANFGNLNTVITPTGGSGFTYDMIYYYTPALIGSITGENNLRFAKYDISTGWVQWDVEPNTTTKSVSVTNLNSFSTFSFGDNNSPLPTELKAFSHSVIGRDVKLNWTTEKEINNKGFEIQRKKQGENNYVNIGFINSKGPSNSQTNYVFEDKRLNSGKYNYRLKQIDKNGNFTYYNLNTVIEIALPKEFKLSQNYPNPFNPTTKIDFELPFDSKVRIVIYDMLGREVKILVNSEAKQAGYYTVDLNATNLSSGTYFYRMIANSQGKDYIFTKKMVIVK